MSSPCDPPDPSSSDPSLSGWTPSPGSTSSDLSSPGSTSPRPSSPGSARRRQSAPPRARRRPRLGVLLLLLAASTTVTLGYGGHATAPRTAEQGRTTYGAAERPLSYPRAGTGSFTAAPGESPVRGASGPVWRYRVAVEQGTGQDVATFAAAVDEVLGDRRSWIASDELRVQRVAEPDDADFTVYLATPETSTRMCAEGGLSTEGYTSCRLPGQVIINLARWMEGVPDYGAPLAVYRAYVVNHEVGHEFGEEHQGCPGIGEPAPVMQQQTYGLDGCAANAWPYVDGSRYDGEPVSGT